MPTSPRRSPARLVLIALSVVVAVAVVWIAAAARPGPVLEEVVRLSGPMPEIDGPALVGRRRVSPTTYQGEVVLVNFWASWCGPCRKEQPGLQRLWKEYRREDVQFIGVNHQDDRAAAKAYVDEFHVSYPSVYDPAGSLVGPFEVPHLPATVLVDASGELRYRLLGAQSEGTLRHFIEELLAGPPK